jgi:phosphoethanolamine N-methyltransferase
MPLLKKPGVNSEQYTPSNVHAYELIYGSDFISPGGHRLAKQFAQKLNLRPDDKVLDVGSGLGGCACMMAQEFEANVDGLDLSSSMVVEAAARCKQKGLSEKVRFFQKDCLKLEDADLYDAVISRDVFLHIADKERLFSNLYRVLKPGGRMLFTDYGCGERPWPWSFARYVKARGYALHTLGEYSALIEQAGFVEVSAEDITPLFAQTLSEEMQRLKNLPWHKRAAFRLAWSSKLKAARKGVHRWSLLQAVKPGEVGSR